jgi:hypothetical protein
MTIQVRYDSRRGCGWRKAGGYYLVGSGGGQPCGRLPLPLHVCPTCQSGIKPSRGWTWIDSAPWLYSRTCKASERQCQFCPASQTDMGRVGLLWVGGQYYDSPGVFMREAAEQGISRRLAQIPRELKIGETWVWLAHQKAMQDPADPKKWIPAVFHMFRPSAIEYVTKGSETPEEIDKMEKRGITPVRVVRAGEQKDLDLKG